MFWKRKPDFVIAPNGTPAMNRWHLIPRNRFLSIYLHNLVQDDPQDLHDHRSWNISIVLRGGYWETMPMYRPLMPEYALDVFQTNLKRKWRGPGSVIVRRATDAHRLELERYYGAVAGSKPASSWSIFITGPTWRTWGFWLKSGWVPYNEYVTVKDGVSVGKNASKPR